jgi:Rrf2 family iron-sulfur cluster assembly transcriptional regulator
MRLEMSKKTDLALKAVTYLDSEGDSAGTAIASAIDTTVNYLPQILKPLVLQGWVCSTPGPGGGYRIGIDLDEVSVLEVIEAVEGSVKEECVLRGAPCPAPEPCALHDSWVRARGALLGELAATSVKTAMSAAPTKGE